MRPNPEIAKSRENQAEKFLAEYLDLTELVVENGLANCPLSGYFRALEKGLEEFRAGYETTNAKQISELIQNVRAAIDEQLKEAA